MMKRVKYIWFMLLLCHTGKAVISQGLPDTVIHIPRVNITAQKPLEEAGLISTRVDTLALKESLTGSLGELLSKHTPVFIKSYGPGALASASFRGTSASHTQVYWNGLNINNPMVGQVDFSLIPVYFIDDLSIYHGGSSLHNGSGALGGSVHVNSTPSWGENLGISVVQGIGSFDTYQTFASIKSGNSVIRGSLRLFHQQSENDFTFFNVANGLWNTTRQQNADFEKYGALGEMYVKPDDKNLFSLHGWLHMSDRNLPPIMSYEGKGRQENQKDDHLRLAAKWKHYNDYFKTKLTAGISQTALDYYLANQTNLGLLINYNSKSNITSYQNKFSAEYQFSNNTTLNGALNYNHHVASINNKKEQTGYVKSRNEAGFSLNIHHKISRKIVLYGLLRQELVDGRFVPLMPSAGMEIYPLKSKNFTLTTNITRNYHLPALNDLYWIPGGNPQLKPEEGYTSDGAASYTWNKKNVSVSTRFTAFMSDINDWILWRPSEFRYWTADNVKHVFARGIEYAVSGSVSQPDFQVKWNANYSFTRTTSRDSYAPLDNSVGKQLIYVPVHQANGLLNMEWKTFYLSYQTSFTGKRHTTTDNSINALSAFTLHNATLGKEFTIGKLETEWQVKVKNLFDKDYQAVLWRAMPGRNYMFLMKIHF
jgi:iron complex outermembrane receptor protein